MKTLLALLVLVLLSFGSAFGENARGNYYYIDESNAESMVAWVLLVMTARGVPGLLGLTAEQVRATDTQMYAQGVQLCLNDSNTDFLGLVMNPYKIGVICKENHSEEEFGKVYNSGPAKKVLGWEYLGKRNGEHVLSMVKGKQT